MNDKQRRFVDEYVIDLNQTQAAIRAGYSEKTATKIASRLLTNVDIQQAIGKKQKAISRRKEITVESLIDELEEARQLAITGDYPAPSAAVTATMGKAKMLGFLTDKIEMSGNLTLKSMLTRIDD